MPSGAEFKANRAGLIVMLIGHFGTGKTLQALTFPDCYVISCDPAGVETVRDTVFEDNLVNVEYFLSENIKELKNMFQPTDKAEDRQSIYGCLTHARELIAAGKVKTVVIDGWTYLNDHRVAEIWECEPILTDSNKLDTQQMYGKLSRSMQRFLISDLLPMATRQHVNVVITCHLQRLSEEQIKGPDDTGASSYQRQLNRKRRKSVMAHVNSDLAPRIEGGLREKIEGLVSASIYLDRRIDAARGIVYEAYCDLAVGMGSVVPGKNRFGMVPKIDITDGSLWNELQPETIARRRQELEARKK